MYLLGRLNYTGCYTVYTVVLGGCFFKFNRSLVDCPVKEVRFKHLKFGFHKMLEITNIMKDAIFYCLQKLHFIGEMVKFSQTINGYYVVTIF